MFKVILLTVAVAFIMALVGWLSFSNSDGDATITIHKDEIRKDTAAAVERVEEVTKDLQSELDKPTQDDDASTLLP